MRTFGAQSLNHTVANYQPEIDGLRALAVLAVIFFHAGFTVFSGGFVGVDVFFVISGYLITSLILTEKHIGHFSLLSFYERRARRILPALFFMMLVCLPMAWFVLLPDQLIDFSKSLQAVPVFISNIFFWKNTGYFSANTLEKPLIHTWSLGIEEQYYLLFPLFIMVFWKLGHRKLGLAIAILLVLSLGVSDFLVRHHPASGFYLIPPRAWELLTGSVLAFIPFKNSPLRDNTAFKYNQILSSIGFALVLLPMLFFNSNTPFPGVYALIPVIGTALIIAFSVPKTFVYQGLSHPYMVKIGLISYSAYLWHQPLFSFTRIYFLEPPSASIWILCIGITLLLAVFSWKFIEQPFRNKHYLSRQQILVGSLFAILFFLSVGWAGMAAQGFPQRLSPYQQRLFSYPAEHNAFNENSGCFLSAAQNADHFGKCTFASTGHKNIVLWGDSHAAHLMAGLQAIGAYHQLRQFTASACPPILGMTISDRPQCQNVNNAVMEKIKQNPPDQIILAGRWNPHNQAWQQLKNTVTQLHQIGIQDIVIIGPAPIWNRALPHILARFNVPFERLPKRLQSYLEKDIFLVDRDMQLAAQQWQVSYVSLLSILCNQQGCLTRLGKHPHQLLSLDDSHFTLAGSKYVASKWTARL